ncbi:DUF2167 domain-containing protein [Rariglobus hedericola]|uniref:DUF2167 domain-containing protein n=1 Tax=Rariglobus hedericola TaxID=2597822 RepID=A0A556QQJ0_9BACT|nr:DUF2167 domain-containing protein [Rariglobus hedericola]TSJ78893.1 DUF2167 domain-containing protein [Rariglobus hedericola]
MFARLLGRSGLLIALSCAASGLFAQEQPVVEAPQQETFVQALEANGIKLAASPAKVKLGDIAEITLPEGFHAVERGSLKKFYEFTRNSMGGSEVGVLIAPGGWMLFFDYDDSGYVKDDDKNSLEAPKLMKSMTSNQDAANKERVKRGWDEMKIAGWAAEPHYDTKTNNLKWAIKLTSSRDNHQSYWINESIRLLGRGGVMEVTLVTDNETFAADSAAADSLLTNRYTYVSGQRYAEFKEGDKIAEYGLAALVLGGAGAVALKLGFFQKFWKFLVFGAVALFGAIGKLWNKITGRNPDA